MESVLGKVAVNVVTVDENGNPINYKEDLIKLHSMLPMLTKLCGAIESIETNRNGDIHITYKNNVIIEANGSIVNHSKKGMILDKAAVIHFNPLTLEEIPEELHNVANNFIAKKDN